MRFKGFVYKWLERLLDVGEGEPCTHYHMFCPACHLCVTCGKCQCEMERYKLRVQHEG